MENTNTDNSKSFAGGVIKVIFTMLFIASTAGFIWSFINYQEAKQRITYLSTAEAQEELAKKEISDLLKRVEKHILLPNGEEPMIATINDVNSLENEHDFYKGAKNGDKLIVYSEKAIIYDSDMDILVNVGPVYTNNQQESAGN